MAKRQGSAADPLWYKDAIVSELHRAFKDSNADPETGLSSGPGGSPVVATLLPFTP